MSANDKTDSNSIEFQSNKAVALQLESAAQNPVQEAEHVEKPNTVVLADTILAQYTVNSGRKWLFFVNINKLHMCHAMHNTKKLHIGSMKQE